MNKKLKILMTGPVLPPAGGISVHIQRLQHLLENEFDIDLIDESTSKKDGIYNIRSLNIFPYLKKISKTDILFIHSGNKFFKKVHIVVGRLFGKKIIITLHGYGPKRKQPFRAFDNMIFRLADKIILVNSDIKNKLSLPAKKIIIKHAFLPPMMKDEPVLLPAVAAWIANAKSKNQVIICANASRLDMHNNQDLYGLDISIEVTRRLVEKKLPVSFIYTVSSIENCTDIFNKNYQLIKDQHLENNFMLISEKLSFVRLIENSDIVLRPTNTDGDALTIREALYLNKKILASDVTERPVGTLLFKTRDVNVLEEKLEELIKGFKHRIDGLPAVSDDSPEDFKSFYVDLIKSIA